jgi:uncharacterized protein DUF6624
MLQKKSNRILIRFVILVFLLHGPKAFAQEPRLTKPVKDSLILELAIIEEADQHYRQQMEEVQSKFGGDSKEMRQLFWSMKQSDSLNFIKVSAILEKFGWLAPETIGSQANTTLFMVIQHSDIDKQELYLPRMRIAVKQGKASAASLALLEDRVALLRNRQQLYGSQVIWNMKTNEYKLLPLEDPAHVDQRRKEAGLPPMKEYLKFCCDMEWDPDSYIQEQQAAREEDNR